MPGRDKTNDTSFAANRRGQHHAGLRRANERAVLTTIAIERDISNAGISRRTGLAPQTVSAIIAELENEGMIQRGEPVRGRRGQPATPLRINPRAAFALGCEIGWRHVELVLVEIGGKVLERYRRDYVSAGPAALFEEIGATSRRMLGTLAPAERARLVGLGIATPNDLSQGSGMNDAAATEAAAWKSFDVVAAAEAGTGLVVQAFNDGNAACWAELVFHPEPRPANFAYLFVGTFIGAGIVAQGVLWEGPTGNSANLGAMLVRNRQGETQFAHFVASISAFEEKLRAAGLQEATGEPQSWPWAAWQPVVDDWIEDASNALARVMRNTSAVIEFDRVLIDGELPRPLLERLVRRTEAQFSDLPNLSAQRPSFAAGRVGASAPAIGAAFRPVYLRYFSRDAE